MSTNAKQFENWWRRVEYSKWCTIPSYEYRLGKDAYLAGLRRGKQMVRQSIRKSIKDAKNPR